CHVRFRKAAQDKLCLDCHKEVAKDVSAKSGMHGRIRIEACRSCHTEHKGREASIAPFEEKKFDHKATDFELRDAHRPLECRSCHAAGKKFRDAPGDCNGCHRKDDKHEGSLGSRCDNCHLQTK